MGRLHCHHQDVLRSHDGELRRTLWRVCEGTHLHDEMDIVRTGDSARDGRAWGPLIAHRMLRCRLPARADLQASALGKEQGDGLKVAVGSSLQGWTLQMSMKTCYI